MGISDICGEEAARSSGSLNLKIREQVNHLGARLKIIFSVVSSLKGQLTQALGAGDRCPVVVRSGEGLHFFWKMMVLVVTEGDYPSLSEIEDASFKEQRCNISIALCD